MNTSPSRAAAPKEPLGDVDTPKPLRAVLSSTQKSQILRLLEDSPAISNDLAPKLDSKRNNVNAHLKELEALGWVHVTGVQQNRGGFSRVWDLTDRTISWRAFLAATTAAAPQPVPLIEPTIDATVA